MIKAILVALVLMVPTQVQAQGRSLDFCKGLSDVAFNVAEGRDMGIPIGTVLDVLMAAGLPYEVAESLSTTVYRTLKDDDPLEVQASFFRVCMGTPA